MSQKHFGEMIYKKRKRLGITQTRLAKSARITQSTISKLESGLALLNFGQAVKVCRTLRIQPARAFQEIGR